jgi:rhodanese-related sulfurtransferase
VNVPEITVTKVHAMRERGDPFTLLDIREKWESDLVTIDGSHYVTMEEVPSKLSDFDKEKPMVVYCHKGVRSAAVAVYLLNQGFLNVKSMVGGIHAWALQIEPTLPTY